MCSTIFLLLSERKIWSIKVQGMSGQASQCGCYCGHTEDILEMTRITNESSFCDKPNFGSFSNERNVRTAIYPCLAFTVFLFLVQGDVKVPFETSPKGGVLHCTSNPALLTQHGPLGSRAAHRGLAHNPQPCIVGITRQILPGIGML